MMNDFAIPKGLRDACRTATAFLVLVGLCGLVCAGCISDGKNANGRFAWVKIQGNTPGQISQMTAEVFREEGYERVAGSSQELTFERKARALSNLTYGNWGDENALFIRVKTEILPDGEQTYLLQCRAYMVRDHATSLEEEIKIHQSGSFQALLNEVARRLNPTRPNGG